MSKFTSALKFNSGSYYTPVIINTPAGGFYNMKEALKQFGWTPKSSGDGFSTYDSAADCLTHSGSGAGGSGNEKAWIRLQASGSSREIFIQIITLTTGLSTDLSVSRFRIAYSRTGSFTIGSPGFDRTPTATDVRYIIGSGTDAVPVGYKLFNWQSTTNLFFGGADKHEPFGFYFACVENASNSSPQHAFAMIPMAAHPDDVDPFVFYANGDSTNAWTAGNMRNSTTVTNQVNLATVIRTWQGIGKASQKWTSAASLFGGQTDGTMNVNSTTAPSTEPFDSKVTAYNLFFGDNTEPAPKGWGMYVAALAIFSSAGTGRRRCYTLNSSNDVIRAGNCLFPWNGVLPTNGSWVNGGTLRLWTTASFFPYDVAITGSSGSVTIIEYDRVAPYITGITPITGTTLSASQVVTFDVVDDSSAFRRILIHASYSNISGSEVIHDHEGFNQRYYSGPENVRTPIVIGSPGYKYRVLRDGGWPGNISFIPFAVDASGNMNT